MRSSIVSICLLSVLVPGSCLRAQTPAAAQSRAEAPKSIHQMFLEDQAEVPAGKPGGNSPITEKEFNARGEARRLQIRSMLAKGDVQTGDDLDDAALLFQHGEDADDYLLAHILSVEAVTGQSGWQRRRWIDICRSSTSPRSSALNIPWMPRLQRNRLRGR